MSTQQKLDALELLWEDLRQNEGDVAPPEWHKDVLAARESAYAEGKDAFFSLAEARQRLRGKE